MSQNIILEKKETLEFSETEFQNSGVLVLGFLLEATLPSLNTALILTMWIGWINRTKRFLRPAIRQTRASGPIQGLSYQIMSLKHKETLGQQFGYLN